MLPVLPFSEFCLYSNHFVLDSKYFQILDYHNRIGVAFNTQNVPYPVPSKIKFHSINGALDNAMKQRYSPMTAFKFFSNYLVLDYKLGPSIEKFCEREGENGCS